MKKLISSLAIISLIVSMCAIPNIVNALDYTEDQGCSADYPYTVAASESVFDNVSLGQSFIPTQNRLRILFLEMMVNAADDDSTLTVAITDFNEETVLASYTYNIMAAMDGDMVLNVTFYDESWQLYDVPLVPGDTYKIKLTASSGSGGVRWAYKADPECVSGGAAIVGGIMDLSKDFGFTTGGYDYVAPVVPPPADPPADDPVVPPATGPVDSPAPDETTTTAATTVTTTSTNTTDTAATDTTATAETTSLNPAVNQEKNGQNSNLQSNSASNEDTKKTNKITSFFSNPWIIGGFAILILVISGLVVFLQLKFHIFTKLFKKTKTKKSR